MAGAVKCVYVAGPFRGPTHWDVMRNVLRAEALNLDVWRLGAVGVCPHKNTENFDGLLTDSLWLAGTMEQLRRCDAMILVRGWRRSAGTRAEVAEATRLGIPVFQRLDELRAWLDEEMALRHAVDAVHRALLHEPLPVDVQTQWVPELPGDLLARTTVGGMHARDGGGAMEFSRQALEDEECPLAIVVHEIAHLRGFGAHDRRFRGCVNRWLKQLGLPEEK